MGKWCRNKKHNWYEQNRKGDVKNSVGNGEAKELTHTTHGHELRAGGIAGRKMGTRWRGAEGENWDNCNSIINKIYLKVKMKFKLKTKIIDFIFTYE